jgi:multidrug efflux pump subunit AcrA (membrane-fusion protein)
MRDRGFVTQEAADAKQHEANAARAALATAEANQAAARQDQNRLLAEQAAALKLRANLRLYSPVAGIVTARETRALADVDRIATFPTVWRDKLGVLRGYMLTCLESNATGEDVFSVKLKQYQKEFDATLALSRAAVNVTALAPTLSLSTSLLRG